MEDLERDDIIFCEKCGAEVSIITPCSCSEEKCGIMCCGQLMKKR